MLNRLQFAGLDEAKLIRQCQKGKRPIPDWILYKPMLLIGLGLYYRAFNELSSCRAQGMQEGPIPWTAIAWWCQVNQINGEQQRKVFRNVRHMDLAYLKHQSKKSPKPSKSQSGKIRK